MIKMKTAKFELKSGVIYNPYIGFTSFQHFRGDVLYSDRISGKSGIAGTETEDYECYPVPEGVAEDGRSEGWYPDTTVAYIRSLWKEFEPRRGEYNYKFIEDILEKARNCGQTVMFRLMPHSTCERDDVPDWLKEMIPCPERPFGMRVKESPTDERFLKLFGEAVAKLGERFDSDKTFDAIDVCLPGAWGEGHRLSDYSKESIEALMDIYVEYFPNTKLIGQVASPMMLNHIGEKRNIGFRGDGTGSPVHMQKHFPENFAKVKSDFWHTGPVSFESYWWISEWERQGWDIDSIIDATLSWHISTFNTKSFPIPYKWREKIERWLEKMGYRFAVREFSYPESAHPGEEINLSFKLENSGVAPIYNKLPFKLKITSKDYEYELKTDIDIRQWLPGVSEEKITLKLPKSIPVGDYFVMCGIGGDDYPTVELAMQAEKIGTWYKLCELNIK